ncbi:MAG: Fic family protein, partial [Desulfobacteraceae bacterium]|nr:Fic family protein [Desulfobacteraceae bacterium]
LRAVSRDGDWTGWCEFFLRGIQGQAYENECKARNILALYDHVKNRVIELTHSQHAIRVVDFLFQSPVFAAPSFTYDSGIPKPTANRILTLLRDKEILVQLREGKGRLPGIYAFLQLLRIAEGTACFEAHP